MAYHPADKTFGSFSGNYLTVEGVAVTQTQQQAPPAEAPKSKGTLPKGIGQTQQAPIQQQSAHAESGGQSKAEKLKDCEDDYLQRI